MTDIEIPLGRRTRTYRFFEMLPLVLSVLLVLTPIILSFFSPLVAAIFVVGYIIMWFVKAVATAYRTIQGYSILGNAQQVDWAARLDELEAPGKAVQAYISAKVSAAPGWRGDVHLRNLHLAAQHPQTYYKPSEVYNLLIVPMYKEERDTLDPTMHSILNGSYNLKNMIFVLAYEQRAGAKFAKIARDVIEEYRDHFKHAVAIEHPADIPNEVVGKGGNITFAAREMQKYLAAQHIDPNRVVVTTLDADNRPSPHFFASLTYEFIMAPNRQRLAFQPISLYMNNIWDVPAPMRVLAVGNSFWTIFTSLRPHVLRNFSSHAQGMQSLIDTDFWSVRTIVEDGHQYWRSYFRFDGDYDVVPIYTPIYQDAVLDTSYITTMKAQFIQLRRWAYGASDIPFVWTKGFAKDSKVPFFGLIGRFMRLLDNHVSWAAASIIVAFGAWAPLFLNDDSNRSIVAHELPLIASRLQQLALIGLFITIFLTFKILPPRPARYKAHRTVFMVLQWAIMPVTSICYGSAAAFTAQFKLFTGRYLDKFDVTAKVVKK